MQPVARILLGVTGGIAAYKACELVRLLVKAGHDVTPLVTRGAEGFVRAETFWALARKSPTADPYPHLERADLLVVAPLTAHTLARLAHGLADDVLTEAALAHDGPVLVAPAMNHRMWAHPATPTNVAVLRSRGVEVVEAPTAADVAREALARGGDVDVTVMAAAVADYRPALERADKRPKDDEPWRIELVPTLDVARALGERRNGALLVAFGADLGEAGLERKRG